MTIEKAMQRIGWRLGQIKPFTPNQNDIDAYNFIVDFVQKKQDQQIIENQLFGKLYIFILSSFLTYYDCDITDSIPQKELNKIIDTDLRVLVSDLAEKINLHRIEHHLKENSSLNGLEKIEYEEVSENLKIMINGALNIYK